MPVEESNDNKDESDGNNHHHHPDEDKFKIHVSRIPTSFDETIVHRILEGKLGKDEVRDVTLIYKRPQEEKEDDESDEKETKGIETKGKDEKGKEEEEGEHRGFGFVTFYNEATYQRALELQTVRGGRKPTSSKKHTMYIRPYAVKNQEEEARQLCFLWAQHRCPYGDDCKFLHQGDGGCLDASNQKEGSAKRKKCFEFNKKGKCKRGDDCPFSHDFTPKIEDIKQDKKKEQVTDSEKDCINWKTKGKCRKGGKCTYKHDETVRQLALEKKKRKQQQQSGDNNDEKSSISNKRSKKQPLWVRVFGLLYDTREIDVRHFLEHCGPIVQVQFPRFEDSGRSKGYCGVLFQSPKAVEKALELDGTELHGRWLRIQAGKMLLDQWESREKEAQANAQATKRATRVTD